MTRIISSSRGKGVRTNPSSTAKVYRGKTAAQLSKMTKMAKGKVVKVGKTKDGCNTIYKQGSRYFILKYKPTGKKVRTTIMKNEYKAKRIYVQKP
jgi:hypothetical protein